LANDGLVISADIRVAAMVKIDDSLRGEIGDENDILRYEAQIERSELLFGPNAAELEESRAEISKQKEPMRARAVKRQP